MVSGIWISVVVPTYNRKESLRITLDGLGRQTLPASEFEVVVVSDGSTDGTNEFLTEYARTAPYRLRPFVQANAGPARARNFGMQEAAGELIVLIDDDVEPIPEFLEYHARRHVRSKAPARREAVTTAAAGRTDVGQAGASSHSVDEVDKLVIIGPMLPDPKRREPVWIAWEHAMLRKQYDAWDDGIWEGAGPMHFYSGNTSFRREWAISVGGFNEQLKRAEDVDLGFRMQQHCGVSFEYDPWPVGVHRPVRSFKSWLNVAESYGRLDVVRARTGANTWDLVRASYVTRNVITRRLADLTFAIPSFNGPIRGALLGLSRAAYVLGMRSAAIAALSVVYNLQYLESARLEMGLPELRRLIVEGA